MKNKILALSLVCVLLCSFSVSATVIDFTLGSTTTNSYNGEILTTAEHEAAPFINENGNTMVPVRLISETFGAFVDWDDLTQTVTITNKETEIKLVIGNNTAIVNGVEVAIESAPVLVNSRTFVPVYFIGTALGYNTNYCSASEQIIIDNTPIVALCGSKFVSFAEFEAIYSVFYTLNHDELVNQGYEEDVIKEYLATYALEEVCNYPYAYNTFPDVPLTDKYKKNILDTAEKEAAFFKTPLRSIVNLIEEKAVFSTLNPVILYYSEQPAAIEASKAYIQAKHILVEDEKLAGEIYEKAISGEDFDALVNEYNIDPYMQQNPTGYIFTKGQMVEPFEKAAFALDYGEISKPVKTDLGYHIIKRSDDDREIRVECAVTIVAEILSNAESPIALMTVEELCALL